MKIRFSVGFCRFEVCQRFFSTSKGSRLGGTDGKDESKPSIFDRLEKSFDKKRQEMEKEAIEKKRITIDQQERANDFFNQKALLENRKKLMEESLEGYFSAYYKVAHGQAKSFTATKLIPAKLARRMPSVDGLDMDQKLFQLSSLIHKKHATLVLMTFNAFGEKHIESFCNPFHARFKDDNRVGLVEFHINEHAIKSPVVNLLAPYIRWRMDSVRRQRYVSINKSIADIRKAAGITNNAIGWASLVDGSGLIRWQAHGLALPEEIEALLAFTEKIVSESSRDGGFGNLNFKPTNAKKKLNLV